MLDLIAAYENYLSKVKQASANTVSSYMRDLRQYAAYLQELNIEPTTKIIAPGALEGCSEIASIIIPESVSFIGQYAFEGCTSLKNVSFVSESWSIINGEKTYVPVETKTTNDDIASDLTEVYYYCAWYKK